MNRSEEAEHFRVCGCHDSWDQCPCADSGHPKDGSCDCCPLGTGLCGPLPTWGQRLDDISARMDAAYANRTAVLKRGHKPGSAEYVAADDAIEAVYRDLRVLNAEMGAK